MERIRKSTHSIRLRILFACVGLMAAGLGLAGVLIQTIYQEAQIASAEANGRVLVDQIADNISRRDRKSTRLNSSHR